MEPEQNNGNIGAEENGGSNGLIIGAIVILAIIILGGLYFWNRRADEGAAINETNLQNGLNDGAVIETDLDATDIENPEIELNAS